MSKVGSLNEAYALACKKEPRQYKLYTEFRDLYLFGAIQGPEWLAVDKRTGETTYLNYTQLAYDVTVSHRVSVQPGYLQELATAIRNARPLDIS